MLYDLLELGYRLLEIMDNMDNGAESIHTFWINLLNLVI